MCATMPDFWLPFLQQKFPSSVLVTGALSGCPQGGDVGVGWGLGVLEMLLTLTLQICSGLRMGWEVLCAEERICGW